MNIIELLEEIAQVAEVWAVLGLLIVGLFVAAVLCVIIEAFFDDL